MSSSPGAGRRSSVSPPRRRPATRRSSCDPPLAVRLADNHCPSTNDTGEISPRDAHPPECSSGALLALGRLERRRRVESSALPEKLERAVGELGRLGATDGLIAQRQRQQHLP
jgi:hypothetical protein